MGARMISAGFALLIATAAIPNVDSALVCTFGAGNMPDLILRNQTYISHTNDYLSEMTYNASNLILSVSTFNLVNYLANTLQWDLTRLSQYVTRGMLLQLDWTNITKPYTSTVSLPSYIQANYVNPVHVKMQYFAATYVMSRGIYRPNVLEFSYSGLDAASMSDIIVAKACLSGSRVLLRVPTDLIYASSYANRNSTDFAAFTTMMESAFDAFFRGPLSSLTHDFIRVNLWVVVAMMGGRYTYVGADLELYFQNVYTYVYIQDYVIANIAQMQPLAIGTTPVSLFASSISGLSYSIAPTTTAVNSTASTTTPSTAPTALTTITPVATSTLITTALLTTTLPTTESTTTSTTSTPSPTTASTTTLSTVITTNLDTTGMSTASTHSTSTIGLIAAWTTVAATNSTPIQDLFSTASTTLNNSLTNSSLLAGNTSSLNTSTSSVNTNATITPNTSALNGQNQTTLSSTNTSTNTLTSLTKASVNSNVTTLNPSQISGLNMNTTLGPYRNGSMHNTLTTYDPDPHFLPAAPVIPKKYNDPILVPRIVRVSAVAPIEVQAAIFQITVPVAAGIIGLITILLVCLQADWLPKLAK